MWMIATSPRPVPVTLSSLVGQGHVLVQLLSTRALSLGRAKTHSLHFGQSLDF